MQHYEGKYSGAALQTFVKALIHSDELIQQILRTRNLTHIDPDSWYELEDARAIYAAVAQKVGDHTLFRTGLEMIGSAPFPPSINDVWSVLHSLDAAYHMNAQGPKIGGITCTENDETSATVIFTTPFPCALERGIVQGCCDRFGVQALIEHGADGCRDQGSARCVYLVTW